MRAIPTAIVSPSSVLAGYVVARRTGRRPLGALPLALGGAWCASRWRKRSGPLVAVGLLGVYFASVAASHPLAKRIGAWPAVVSAAAATALASWLLSDRR